MTQTHPITPPLELVEQWMTEAHDQPPGPDARVIATQAARWGADQELEAGVNYINNNISGNKAREFRAIRRPKPSSLKEEARQIIDCLIEGDCLNDDDAVTLLRVLEAFND